MQGLSELTIYTRRKCLERLANGLPVPIAEATLEMLLEWRVRMALCNQSVANYVSDARQFYEWARKAGRLRTDNPVEFVPIPRPARRLPRPIKTADLVAAINKAPRDIRPWLILAAFCGLRCKEIALLRRECILDQAHEPAILIASDATKGNSERMIPLLPLVLHELEVAGLPASGWLFPRLDGQRGPNNPHEISRRGNRHLRECGIKATMHQLRHWYATEIYGVDHDILVTAELLGHTDLRATRVYALISQARKVETMRALPIPAALLEAA